MFECGLFFFCDVGILFFLLGGRSACYDCVMGLSYFSLNFGVLGLFCFFGSFVFLWSFAFFVYW